jgi:tetratricopeptide (TPR) repeat protein
MAVRFLLGCLAVLLTSLSAFSQLISDGGPIARVSANASGTAGTQHVIVSGKVVTDGGGVPDQQVTIQRECNGHARTVGYTDASGSFQFDANSSEQANAAGGMLPAGQGGASELFLWANCDLKFELAGFTSRPISLAGIEGSLGATNLGTIVIHRVDQSPEAAVSAQTLAVPEKAKKEFEKGKRAESKGMWAAAREKFQNALKRYPKFALAWLELGRVQVQQKEITAARESFQNALASDSNLSDPYTELTNLAIEQKEWKEVTETTGRMLQGSGVNSPRVWFYNAAGNFNLGRIDQAEKSLIRGMRLDPEHRYPQMEYLMGLVSARKHDYAAAVMHVSEYLRLSPEAPDAAVARQQLADFQKLAGMAAGQ